MIDINPGPKQSSMTFCHSISNSICAHGFIKISLLQEDLTEHNFDIICLSEAFLNLSLDSKGDRSKINGYNLIRSDYPSGSKNEAFVFVTWNVFLLLERTISVFLGSCLLTEIRSENKKCFFTCLCQSPNQNQYKCVNFCTKFDTLITHICSELSICSILTIYLAAKVIS